MSIFWIVYFVTAVILTIVFTFMGWQDFRDKTPLELKTVVVAILLVITPVLNVYIMCSGVIELYHAAMKRYRKRTK